MLATLLIIIAIILFFTIRLYSLGQKSLKMSPKIGLVNGALLACGTKPNCISSTDVRESFNFTPRDISQEEQQQLFERLATTLKQMPNVEIVRIETNYIHATHTSSLFKFVDDMEFHLKDGRISVRSESRVGHSDIGQNRKRMETILETLFKKK